MMSYGTTVLTVRVVHHRNGSNDYNGRAIRCTALVVIRFRRLDKAVLRTVVHDNDVSCQRLPTLLLFPTHPAATLRLAHAHCVSCFSPAISRVRSTVRYEVVLDLS